MNSNPRISDGDFALLSRLADGQCNDLEARSLRSRMEREPALASAFAELQGPESWFAQARAGEPKAAVPSGFADSVMAQVRRLPDRETLARVEADVRAELAGSGGGVTGTGGAGGDGADGSASACGLARQLTLAALVILGAALLVTAGLWTAMDATELEASPAEIERAMQALDAQIAASDLDLSGSPRRDR